MLTHFLTNTRALSIHSIPSPKEKAKQQVNTTPESKERFTMIATRTTRPVVFALAKTPKWSKQALLQSPFLRQFSSNQDNTEQDRVVTTLDSATGIATVELNRPDKLNALDLRMFHAIRDAAVALRDDRSVRAVILQGRGRAFCTGLDVASLGRDNPVKAMRQLLERSDNDNDANLAQDVAYAWRTLPVPVIAAVHGMCFGGGLQIALGADIRLVTADCRLSVMEAKWGLIPDMSASLTLRELVSIDVAKELTWTGKIVSGEEAAKLGLCTRVVDDPATEARALAEQIVRGSPDATAAAKEMFHKTWAAPSASYCLRVETELQERLLLGWNQVAAASRAALGWKVPYFQRQKERPLQTPEEEFQEDKK